MNARVILRILIPLLAVAVYAASPRGASNDPPFELVQPNLHRIPNTYANAWGDFDNDGDLDLAVSTSAHGIRLFRNDHGTLVSVGASLGLPETGYELRGLSWGDYDADGYIDLLAGPIAADTLSLVFHNDAGRHFTEVSARLGLTLPKRSARQTNWVDIDNDGNFDLFAANYGRNQLYHNNGDGTFTDIAKAAGLDVENHAVSADWGDYDNDGYLDLSIMSYVGAPGVQTPKDALFHNDGHGGFVNVIGADSALNRGNHGTQFVDFDGDGGLDLSITDGYGPEGGLAATTHSAWGRCTLVCATSHPGRSK